MAPLLVMKMLSAYPSIFRNHLRPLPRLKPNGCTIFVKLWQFDMDDRNQFHVDTVSANYADDASRPGVSVLKLHKDEREEVVMEKWAPGADVTVDAPGGAEVLVVEGGFTEGDEQFAVQSWGRLPSGGSLRAIADATGAKVWIKRGHLVGEITAPDE